MSERASSALRGGYDADGDSHYRYRVSLRIWHPNGDPAAWTQAFGLEPDISHTVGERVVRRGDSREAQESYWLHEFEGNDESKDLEISLSERLDYLRKHVDVLSALMASGGEAQILIGFFLESFNSGFELTPALLRDCAELGLSLSFDIYDKPAAAP